MPRKKNETRSADPEVDSPREAWAGPERRQEPRGVSEGLGGPRLRRKSDESLAQ